MALFSASCAPIDGVLLVFQLSEREKSSGTSPVPTPAPATEPIHRTINRDALRALCAFQHFIYSFNLKSVLLFLIIETMLRYI